MEWSGKYFSTEIRTISLASGAAQLAMVRSGNGKVQKKILYFEENI